MKKRFTRWLGVMLSIIMALSTSIGVLAETNEKGTTTNTQNAYMTGSMGMFVNNASAQVRTNSDGSMEAVITYMRGTNTYPKVFLGTVEEANAADASEDTSKVYEAVLVENVYVDKDGKPQNGYQYVFPLEKLDTEFALSLYSSSKAEWRANTLMISLKDPSAGDGDIDDGNGGDAGDSGNESKLIDGTYVGVGAVPDGKYPTNGYDVSTAVEIKNGKIASVQYTDLLENDGNISYKKWALNGHYMYDEESKLWSYIKGLAAQLLGKSDTTGLDAISGATKTSNAIIESVDKALEKAKTGETSSVTIPTEKEDNYVPVSAPTGIYSVDVACNGLTVIDAELTSKNGQMTAVITLGGTGTDLLYFGTEEEAYKAGNENLIENCGTKDYVNASGATKTGYQFEIPVATLNKDLAFISHAKSSNKWFYRTIKFDSATLVKTGEAEDDEPENPGTDTPSDTKVILPSGTYSVSVDTGAPMFKVVDCKIVVNKKTLKAVVTLSGTGYEYLYQGTAKEAEAAGTKQWSKYKVNANGQYQYVISLPYDDFVTGKTIAVSSYSPKTETWYDRTLQFDLESLAVVSASTKVDGSLPTTGNENANNNNNSNSNGEENKDNTLTDKEINDKLNKVDKDTTVKDGTYVPEFGFTGGSGRATITCSKVVVKNGKATATITFSSPNFTWVKSLGEKVYNQNKGGNSTFVIPINLNSKTTISAETTAMSQPYTVDYILYCFIDGTKVTTTNTTAEKNDVIELEASSAETEKETDAVEEENGWGSFYDEAETTTEEVTTQGQNHDTLVKVLTVLLILVCIYALVGTIYAVSKMRKMKGE